MRNPWPSFFRFLSNIFYSYSAHQNFDKPKLSTSEFCVTKSGQYPRNMWLEIESIFLKVTGRIRVEDGVDELY